MVTDIISIRYLVILLPHLNIQDATYGTKLQCPSLTNGNCQTHNHPCCMSPPPLHPIPQCSMIIPMCARWATDHDSQVQLQATYRANTKISLPLYSKQIIHQPPHHINTYTWKQSHYLTCSCRNNLWSWYGMLLTFSSSVPSKVHLGKAVQT